MIGVVELGLAVSLALTVGLVVGLLDEALAMVLGLAAFACVVFLSGVLILG